MVYLLCLFNSINIKILICCFVFQDTFFYSLVYDPQQKTLLADKGEIRVGTRYQADIPTSNIIKPGNYYILIKSLLTFKFVAQ